LQCCQIFDQRLQGVATVVDIVDDQYATPANVSAQGIANDDFALLFCCAVVFHANACQIRNVQEVADDPSGRIATPAHGNDQFGLKTARSDNARQLSTQAIDRRP
jgi:hypothetical protein